jgi:hypothetical protein
MKRIVLGALLLSTLHLGGNAIAATASASMEVSFVVKESCTVQMQDDASGAAPTVACGHDAPYRVQPQSAPQSGAPAAGQPAVQANGQGWQITF